MALAEGYPDSHQSLGAVIDAYGLRLTEDEYDEYCEEGFDLILDESHRLLRPVESCRFCASQQFPGGCGRHGGIKINHKIEVLGKNWRRVPGLFAAECVKGGT